MAGPDPILRTIADPSWLAHRYDPQHDAFHFIPVSREQHRAATFLTDAELAPVPEPRIIARPDAVAARAARGPVHFLFHSAFCCSTLLAKAFDQDGVAVALKEPVLLNDLVGWRHRGASGRDVAERMDHALMMLERPFADGEAVLIKPSNIVNGLAELMLRLRPDSRAILLHAPLPVYLRSITKKGMEGRLWVRDLMAKQLREGAIRLGLDGEDYLRLTDLQAAAIGWLAQHMSFARLIDSFGPARVRSLNSETLMAAPRETLTAMAAHCAFPLSAEGVDAIVAGPVFARNAKTGQAYDAKQRQTDYDAAHALHGEEIDQVTAWALAVAATFNVPMDLPHPLTPQ